MVILKLKAQRSDLYYLCVLPFLMKCACRVERKGHLDCPVVCMSVLSLVCIESPSCKGIKPILHLFHDNVFSRNNIIISQKFVAVVSRWPVT